MKSMIFASTIRAAYTRTCRIGSEAGSSLVEFAMTFGVLAAMILGIMEFGLALYTYNYVSEMAREASRYASVRGNKCSGFSDCGIDQSGLLKFVKGLGYPGLDGNNVSLTANWSCSAADTAPCNSPTDSVQVKVSYAFPLAIPFVSSNTMTITSTSQMVITQ